MPRKCSTHFDGNSCDSGYPGSKFEGTVHGFPNTRTDAGRQECAQWLAALPNYIDINNVTKHMGICAKHWKPGVPCKRLSGGSERPIEPPTEFGSIPKSFHQQTVTPGYSRKSESRNVLSEDRSKVSFITEREKDRIKTWDELVTYCQSLNLNVTYTSEFIRLCKLSDQSFPPRVEFSVQISSCYNVQAYRESTEISLAKILKGYQYKLVYYSQIGEIISKLESSQTDFRSEVKALTGQLMKLSTQDESMNDASAKRLEFICAQLTAHTTNKQHQGKKYDIYLISEAVNLFLRSRNAYRALRNILILPCENTIRSFFGTFGTAGSEEECVQVVGDVFSSLEHDWDKHVFVSADEIYVTPSIRFRASHVLGFAQNHDTPIAAKTVLALMINFLRGKPAFVARLSPVRDLGHQYLFDELVRLLKVIHKAGGYVFGVVTDNLSVNQKTFKDFQTSYTSQSICSVDHPISNTQFSSFYTLYDTTHLLKNIRNNWITEKTKTLEFIHPYTNKKLIAKWSDIVEIHRKQESNIVKTHTLDYATLYPNNFEKQKVQLVANVFNEKIVACLKMNGKYDTATFVELVTRMWKILNIKSPDAAHNLNDPDREKFTSENDPRLDFLLQMAKTFKLMDASKKGDRVKCLTSETANALHQTLHAIVDITKNMLRAGHPYVLPGKIQSDRLEGEFGIFRGGSGGNYYIAYEQVLYSLSLQRLKLYDKLEITQSSIPELSCCAQDLRSNDEDIELIENCFSLASVIKEDERSALYYIAGYVAFKENLGVDLSDYDPELYPLPTEGEFLHLVSRGKLSHPPSDLFDLCLYYYSFYESRKQKCCQKIFLEAFEEIYTSTNYEFDNIEKINRRFANCFFKAFVKKESSAIKSDNQRKNKLKRKLNN